MNVSTKKNIKVGLDRMGVHIKPARNGRPLDLSAEKRIDPVSALYSSEGRDVLIEVPLQKCRTLNLSAFPPVKFGLSPFVQTIQDYYEQQNNKYDGSALREFYNRYSPQSAADLLGLANPSYRQFSTLPPSAAVVPWRTSCPDTEAATRTRQIEQENKEHGLRLASGHGDSLYGPVSDAKGELEFKRLIKIAASIRANGLKVDRRGIDNVTVVALLSGSDWRLFVSSSGQHRLSALAALGFRTAVVQLRVREGAGGLVRRCDADKWAAVRRGLLSECEALSIFDRLFNGHQPASANRWLSQLQGFDIPKAFSGRNTLNGITNPGSPR